MVTGPYTFSPTPIPPNSVQIERYVLKSLTPEHMVHVAYNNPPDGLILVKAWCEVPDTIDIAWWNLTGNTINPSSNGTPVLRINSH